MSTTIQKKSPQTVGAVVGGSEETHPNFTSQTKSEATLLAKFALLGHAVHRLADGGFLVTRWGLMTRHCPDAASLAAFLATVGGRL